MNLQRLRALVASGESDRLEFKRGTGERREAAKTVCAMLNGLGGFVLSGVNDAGLCDGRPLELAVGTAHSDTVIYTGTDRVAR